MSEAGEILVFGRRGQIAAALAELCGQTGRRARFLGRGEADLCDPAQLRTAVAAAPWRAVVNAAAYTDVDHAEDEPGLAHAANAAGPGVIAEACRERGVPLIHLSTNFVFDGAANAPYREDDAPVPLSVYGRTKLAGEAAVQAALAAHVILRTGWVFAPVGRNFPASVLAAGRGRASLAIVADEWGDPTPARDLADAVLAIADQIADRIAGRFASGPTPYGTYHFSGAPSVSRLAFAAAVFKAAARSGGGTPPRLDPIASADYAARARRPLNGRLDCGKIERRLGLGRPDWRPALDDAVRHILASGAVDS